MSPLYNELCLLLPQETSQLRSALNDLISPSTVGRVLMIGFTTFSRSIGSSNELVAKLNHRLIIEITKYTLILLFSAVQTKIQKNPCMRSSRFELILFIHVLLFHDIQLQFLNCTGIHLIGTILNVLQP